MERIGDDLPRRATEAAAYAGLEERLRSELLPDLELVRPIGFGTMAGVFLAREVLLRRLVAIKVLGPHVAHDRKARVRFEREAQSAARIAHPNVVTVYRAGTLSDETPYLVMRYIRGTTLQERLLGSGPFDLDTGVEIISQMAAALAAAHQLGVVHRDVKPGNILYEETTGRAFLSDFGLVSILATGDDAPEKITTQGHVVGEMIYSSPEELRGEEVTERADVYTLGYTAYELLSGEGPYGATGLRNVVAGHLTADPVSLCDVVDGCPPELAALLIRCLSKQPATRPAASDVARQLGGRRVRGAAIAVVDLDGDGAEADPLLDSEAPVSGSNAVSAPAPAVAERLRFTTLGGADLRTGSGTVIRSVLSQPKRVALLAYLGLASSGGFARRDILMAMFWPSASTDRARHSLRQSVYVLRRALGPNVVLSRGDDELGLASEWLTIDAATFIEQLETGHPEAAMELYSGDFLPGFYVPDAPDFEYWLHAERRRLRDRAAGAAHLIANAREKAGEPDAAGKWARRAGDLAPFDETLQRDVIGLLARIGDRIAAMQVYDQFVDRLRDEYEMDPAKDTRDLASMIRSGSLD